MGFPTEIVLPKVFVHLLTVLGLIRKLVTILSLNSDIEILSVVNFSDLKLSVVDCSPHSPCSVCLYDFKPEDEIRRLTNCRHIFHRTCLDRWMGYDHKTCPLCRTPFLLPNPTQSITCKIPF
ncbi:brassinosteroid-responsive RING protein 1 [Cicer arietinum]|uniref:Probable E3 ubiquitin-protein ligase RHA1A n=1 Tax=Cicer arietinum TaxID=3827 RepID=A0A1S2YXM0_CICAR|nr:probable E3 ubiquitin-protein ligase RHA1A [Cicer arietinum]